MISILGVWMMGVTSLNTKNTSERSMIPVIIGKKMHYDKLLAQLTYMYMYKDMLFFQNSIKNVNVLRHIAISI